MDMIWHRYGDKRPKAEQTVWVLTKRMKAPELRTYQAPYARGNPGDWSPGGGCRPDDLWCEPIVPEMPPR